jgi:hypothetical protein
VAIAIIVGLLIQACRKETFLTSKGPNSLSIAEAKNYFEANFRTSITTKGKTMSLRENEGKIPTYETIMANKQAIWDKAYQQLISVGGAVRVPLDFGKVRVVVDKTTGATMDLSALNYLLMYRDSLQNIHAEWVYLQPTLDWLNGNRATYKGKVIIRDWDGKVLRKLNYATTNSDLKSSKVSAVKGTIMDGNGGSYVVWNCFRVLTGLCAANNLCKNAGYAQCDFCLQFCAVEICVPEPECDNCNPPPPPAGGTGSSNNGNGQIPGTNGTGGGSPSPNDYVPLNCNPDPNYVDPHIVNADGSMSVPACRDIPVPYPPNTPNPPNNPYVLALQNFINELQITDVNAIAYLANNQNVFTAIKDYLNVNGWTPENKEFGKWAVGYWMEDPYISLGLLDNIYDVVRYQNTTPRDREPVSYPRRTSLSNSDGSDNFSSLNETTPLYTYPNGVMTVNLDAFNCHYYTFGLQYATKVDDEHPKWVIAVGLKATEWEQVTGNAQVGDKVLYYKNYNDKPAFVHSAIVTEVDVDGYATKVSSKMGPYEIITHHPRDIPVSYGSSGPTFSVNTTTGTVTYPSRIYWRKK